MPDLVDMVGILDFTFSEDEAEQEERNIEIARQMKSEEEPVEKIVRFTGLTTEEIGRGMVCAATPPISV